jgi:hypothetical protein
VPTDEAVVNKAISEELPPLFDYLEGQLGTGDWLVGRSFSVADIGVATQFAQASLAGVSPDAKRWPKLAAYIERTLRGAAASQDLVKSGAMESLRTEQFTGGVEKPRASFLSFGGSFCHLFSRRLRLFDKQTGLYKTIYENHYRDCNTRAENAQPRLGRFGDRASLQTICLWGMPAKRSLTTRKPSKTTVMMTLVLAGVAAAGRLGRL